MILVTGGAGFIGSYLQAELFARVGSGVSRSHLDVADAARAARSVEFVEMQEALKPQYQSFAEARMARLRAAGYARDFTSLDDGVSRYVGEYLTQPNPYR